MGKFRVTLTDKAKADIKKHFKSGNRPTIKKIEKILRELTEHPYTGIGQPEQLKYDLSGYWSRRINLKDRMVYMITDSIVRLKLFLLWVIIPINDNNALNNYESVEFWIRISSRFNRIQKCPNDNFILSPEKGT